MLEALKHAIRVIVVILVLIPPINIILYLVLVVTGGEFIRLKLGLPGTDNNKAKSQGLAGSFLLLAVSVSILGYFRLNSVTTPTMISFLIVLLILTNICGFAFYLSNLIYNRINLSKPQS